MFDRITIFNFTDEFANYCMPHETFLLIKAKQPNSARSERTFLANQVDYQLPAFEAISRINHKLITLYMIFYRLLID